MPQIRGAETDTEANPAGRIKGARRLLTTAPVVMSAFLVTTSFTTVVLIPQQEFQPGGQANGRALAFLAHEYLGVGSAPSTTSAPSPSSGSLALPPWPGC
jgi:hypothetical protein